MALTPQRFTRKPETVEAVQVTVENIAEVAEWSGGDVSQELRTGLPAILLEDGGVALLGEWVTRSEHGYFEAESAGFEHGWQRALPSTAQVSEYRLRPVPTEVVVDGRLWDVLVRRFGDTDRWTVGTMFDGQHATGTGEWAWSVRRFEPDKAAWDETFLFSSDEAMAVADKAQWTQVINGKTAADVLAKHGEAKP